MIKRYLKTFLVFYSGFGVIDCGGKCKEQDLPKNAEFVWRCEDNNANNAVSLGIKCKLVCGAGFATKHNIETTCTEVGWTKVNQNELTKACQEMETCFNVLTEGSHNGHWECTDWMSKKCLRPKEGSLCELMCDEGFHHSHGKTSVCTDHGWVPEIDNYRCLSCSPPMKPFNGEFLCEMSPATNQTVCFLTCDQGYRPKEVTVMTCEAGGGEYTPTPSEASCLPIHPKPDRPVSSHELPPADYSEDLTYSADHGCTQLPSPDFGRFECEADVCRLVCNQGYTIPAVVSATCVHGEWCTQDFAIGCRNIKDQ